MTPGGAPQGPAHDPSPADARTGSSARPGTAVGRRRAEDAVFTFSSADTWNDACSRGMFMPADRLAAALLDDPGVRRVLVANPFRSWPIRAVRHSLGQRQAPLPPHGPGEGRLLQPLRVRRAHPTTPGAIARLYSSYDERLRGAAAQMGMDTPAVITCNPFVAAWCSLEWSGPVTFYAFDDWASYPAHREWWPAYEAAYGRISRLGRRVCAVSRAIVDRIAPTGPAVVVPNGLAPDEWAPPWEATGWFRSLPRPRVLYVGSLDDRLDVPALAETAHRFPGGSVVLVGPLLSDAAVAPLRKAPNVTIAPPVGRRGVAGLVHDADVCVLPHRRTSLTNAMSPLKLYEYLAGGRPVAATDLPPVRAVAGRIVLVGKSESFSEGVARALALGPCSEEERTDFVTANSWARRHRAILDFALPR